MMGTDGATLTSAEARVIDVNLGAIRSEQRRLADAVQEISRNLAVLARMEVEQRHIVDQLTRLTNQVHDQDTRLNVIERNMPQLLEMRKWVVMGILAGVGMIGTATFKLVFVDGARNAVTQFAPNTSVKP